MHALTLVRILSEQKKQDWSFWIVPPIEYRLALQKRSKNDCQSRFEAKLTTKYQNISILGSMWESYLGTVNETWMKREGIEGANLVLVTQLCWWLRPSFFPVHGQSRAPQCCYLYLFSLLSFHPAWTAVSTHLWQRTTPVTSTFISNLRLLIWSVAAESRKLFNRKWNTPSRGERKTPLITLLRTERQ